MALLEISGISKSFPGTQALQDVDFNLEKGEVHVLLGENGAGKSTLIKILSGALLPDNGLVCLDGEDVGRLSPHRARDLGITTIYQEFNLIPELSIAENMFLGRLPIKGAIPRVDWRKMAADARNFFERFGIPLNPEIPVGDLSVAEQQLVEIAKALSIKARIIILDEPTATLSDREIAALFTLIRRLRKDGIAVIYISHRLEEVTQIGDRVTVLRDGKLVACWPAKDLKTDDIIHAMVGRHLGGDNDTKRAVNPTLGEIILQASNLSDGLKLRDINLNLRRGEILGLAGLVGSGRTEVARLIFGANPVATGTLFVNGRDMTYHSCRDSIRAGLGFLPEDRKTEGLILGFNITRNISLPSLKRFQRFGFMRKRAERAAALNYIAQLSIRATGVEQVTAALSGGNQQKVVLAKWLLTKADILIFDEPTRGIDVGAKEEFYRIIMRCAERGTGVIMISSELSELMRLCDRIVVLREGQVSGECLRSEFDSQRLLSYAFGQ